MRIIAFNWKLNPATAKQAESLFDAYQAVASRRKNSLVVVCPPFEYLWSFEVKKPGLGLGAQGCFWENLGPFTGTVSALNLKLSGIDYVILGHSERRLHLGETDAMVNKKVLNAVGSGLKPILCFGEALEIHEKGESAIKKFIKKQISDDLKGLNSFSLSQRSNIIFVYEPIWAISSNSGNVAENPEEAAGIIKYIKSLLATDYQLPAARVLYGGSVNQKNISGFLAHETIDGFLVGRASLDKEEIKKIIQNIFSYCLSAKYNIVKNKKAKI